MIIISSQSSRQEIIELIWFGLLVMKFNVYKLN